MRGRGAVALRYGGEDGPSPFSVDKPLEGACKELIALVAGLPTEKPSPPDTTRHGFDFSYFRSLGIGGVRGLRGMDISIANRREG